VKSDLRLIDGDKGCRFWNGQNREQKEKTFRFVAPNANFWDANVV